MNKNLIHWWELPHSSHICLSNNFLSKLKNKRKRLNYSQEKLGCLIGVKEATIHSWEKRKRRPSVRNLMNLLKILKISFYKIYGNILFIMGKSGRKIKNLKLPYNEKNEHIQILAHGFFDGTEDHATENGSGGLVYQSSNEIEQRLFKNLIINSKFGFFKLNKNKKNYYFLPGLLNQLLMKHYNIYTLNSRKARFSNYMMDKIKKNIDLRNAILKVAYVDEGSCGKQKIRDNLCVFSSVNPRLIKQISEILKISKYKFFVNNWKRTGVTSIYLYSDSLHKFYKDVAISLPNKYYKRRNIEILLKRQERENNIKKQLNIIEKILKNQRRIRVMEIQKLFNIHEASARRRLQRLIRIGKIIKCGRGIYETNK